MWSWPASRVPAFWQQTLQQQDTQQRLAANVFRAVTLIDHAPAT
jgi:transposase